MFRTEKKLEAHKCGLPELLPEDNGKYVCSECGKVYTQRYHLEVHLSGHLGIRPFVCGICGKAFARKDVLGVHMLVHSEACQY